MFIDLDDFGLSWTKNGQTKKADYDDLIAAYEKRTPKKIKFVRNTSDTRSIFQCDCGQYIVCMHNSGVFANVIAYGFCNKCGQAIDWEGAE